MRTFASAAIVACLALSACSKDSERGAQAVIEGWKKAGLETSGFEAPSDKPIAGGRCRAGSVGGLEVTLCEYGSADAAEKARPVGLETIGDTTGLALADGRVLLVLADRKKTDPSGRRINQVSRSFLGK